MRVGRRTFAVAVAAVLASGCAAPSDELRHDLDPLLSRFPGLGEPVEATWVSWDNNSGRSSGPGPTTYWIDAIVELEPRRAEELRAAAPDDGEPSVHDALRPSLPPGPFLAGPELNAAIAGSPGEPGPQWTVTGYVETTGNRLILNAIKPA
jgi:hypothetical protein